MIEKDFDKEVLIVGNGGSSVNTRAKNLSKGKDIFRVNKFFLEPFPIFGRKIKLVVFPGEPFFIFFIDYIVKNKIYDIELVCYKKLHRRFFIPKTQKNMLLWDDFVIDNHCKESVPGFYDANQIDSRLKYGKITSGPYLVNCAIQMGYKNISIIGIDFYSEKSGKQYPISIPKIWKKISIFEAPFRSTRANKKRGSSYDQGHSIAADVAYMEALVDKYKDVTFNVYTDEGNPYINWQHIAESGSDNMVIHKMDEMCFDEQPAHCLPDIEKAVIEYKNDYFWKDKIMNAKHLFAHRGVILKNSFLGMKEYLLKVTN